jgi:hypothetical protein
MKKVFFLRWFPLLLLIGLVIIACEKETPVTVTPVPPPLPPQPPPPAVPQSQNSPRIHVRANVDITVELPINFAVLSGNSDGTYNIPANDISYQWRNISGPASFSIQKPDSLKTVVSNLAKGIYLFELTVSAARIGMSAKDTMVLDVEDASSSNKQVFFRKVWWICPMGCTLPVADISDYIPTNTPFSVYIKREFSSTWDLVKPSSQYPGNNYFYERWPDGTLVVFEDPETTVYDQPDVKIVF